MTTRKRITYEQVKAYEGKTAKEIATAIGCGVNTVYRIAKTFGITIKPGSNPAPTIEEMKRYEGMTYKEIAAASGLTRSWAALHMRKYGLTVKLERGKHDRSNTQNIQKVVVAKPPVPPPYETVGLPLSQLPPITVLPPVPRDEPKEFRLARLAAAKKANVVDGKTKRPSRGAKGGK